METLAQVLQAMTTSINNQGQM